jgi:hypothetical protein
MVFTEQANVHIDMGHANFYIRFIFKVHAFQRPTGANVSAADAVFPAVVFIKGQNRRQDTGNTVLPCISMDDIVRT